jgi:hypothetical protein
MHITARIYHLKEYIRLIFNKTYLSFSSQCCNLCSPLTVRITGRGFSLHGAGRIASGTMVRIFMVPAVAGETIGLPGFPGGGSV